MRRTLPVLLAGNVRHLENTILSSSFAQVAHVIGCFGYPLAPLGKSNLNRAAMHQSTLHLPFDPHRVVLLMDGGLCGGPCRPQGMRTAHLLTSSSFVEVTLRRALQLDLAVVADSALDIGDGRLDSYVDRVGTLHATGIGEAAGATFRVKGSRDAL